jgi:hypothetical protein
MGRELNKHRLWGDSMDNNSFWVSQAPTFDLDLQDFDFVDVDSVLHLASSLLSVRYRGTFCVRLLASAQILLIHMTRVLIPYHWQYIPTTQNVRVVPSSD